MPISSVNALLSVLTQQHMLEPLQQDETARELVNRFLDPMALASELVRRNWLTAYQVQQIFSGQSADLLLGPYVLLEPLGEGGMGTVFKARNWKLRMLAALKRIRHERLAKTDSVHRFQREIRAAARLNHPNIVLAYDADEVGGTYFFAMEYVDGTDLGKLVKKQGPLPVAEACDYIRQAGLGLQHAFEQGLVHRDIKPSNLMLKMSSRGRDKPDSGSLGATPRTPDSSLLAPVTVKILDFGLARLEHGSGDLSSASLTATGAVMGTPDYLSPEQARQTHEVDIRSDLYSLGCTLYYLLSGRPPFASATIITAKLLAHQQDDPPPITQLRPEVPAEVAAILSQLLAKRTEERFQTPAELVAALADPAAWFAGPHRQRRSSEAIPRPRSAAVGGLATAGVAQPSMATAAESATDTRERFGGLVPGNTATDVKVARDRQQQADNPRWRRWSLLGAAVLLVLVAGLLALIKRPGPAPNEEVVKSQPPILEPSQPMDLWALVAQPAALKGLKSWTLETRGHRGQCRALAFGPDSQRLATLGDDGTLRLWDVADGRLLQAMPGHRPLVGGYFLAWSSDGQTLASGSSAENAVRCWAPDTGRLLQVLSPVTVNSLAWSPNGQLLAVGGRSSVQLWNGKWQKLRSLDDPAAGSIISLSWSADSKMLAASCEDKKLRLWNVGSRKLRYVLDGDTSHNTMTPLAWSEDNKRLASVTKDNKTIHLWDVVAGKLLRSHGPVPNITSLAWVALGKVTTQKGAVLWEAEPGKFLHIRSHAGSLSPDGKILARPANPHGPSATGTVHLVDADTGKRLHAIDGYGWLVCQTMAYAPDSQTLATNGPGATVALWETRTGHLLRLIRDDPAHGLAWSPDSKSLAIASAGANPLLRLWDVRSGDRLHTLHNGTIGRLRWSPDGKLLAGAWGNTAVIWDVKTGQPRHAFKGHDKQIIYSLAWSLDGKLFLTGWANPEGIGVWDANTNKLLQTLKGDSHVTSLAWSPDGKLASGSAHGSGVRVWDLKTPKPRFILSSEGHVQALAWAPDRRKPKLSSGNEGGKIFIWNAETSLLEDSIKSHPGAVNHLTWLYGSHILASGDGQEVKFWEVKTGKLLRTIPGAGRPEFSPDLETVAGNALANGIRLWNADNAKPRGTLYFLGDQPLAIAAQGCYRGKIADLVHLTQLPDGSQEVLTPEEFASKYDWKNDPEQVQLLPPLKLAR